MCVFKQKTKTKTKHAFQNRMNLLMNKTSQQKMYEKQKSRIASMNEEESFELKTDEMLEYINSDNNSNDNDNNDNNNNNDISNNDSNDICFVELPWKLTVDNIKHFPKYRIEIIDLNVFKHPKYPNANVMLLFYHKTLFNMFKNREQGPEGAIGSFWEFYDKHGKWKDTITMEHCTINSHSRYATIIENGSDTAEDIKDNLLEFCYFPPSMIQILKPQCSHELNLS